MNKDGKKNLEEEIWILEKEQEKRKELKMREAEERKEEEQKKLKDSHYMHCPKCGNKMTEMIYKKGDQEVHIDKCPICKAITLDDGELDIILEINKGILSKILKI